MRPLARLLPLALAAALAGCGQEQSSTSDFEGTEKAVAQVVEDLQSAAQGRKPAEICNDLLTRELADQLKVGDGDCVDEMEKVAGDAEDFQLEVTDVTVTGTTATAQVKGRKGGDADGTTTFRLTREDGDWRLADLGAS
jgi:hypothetical protein